MREVLLKDDFLAISYLVRIFCVNIADAKDNNSVLIEPTLRTLGVKFDTRIANDVMVGKPGAAQKMLYQIMVAVRGFERNNLGNDPAVTNLSCPMPDRGPGSELCRQDTAF
eukprot:SAG31_NODE_481_length_15082_cov_13.818728_6_plen_111_part_00